jgi:GAF domain-containing protein
LFAAEKQARAAAEEAAERLERLQAITARLSQASSLDEVADVVVSTTAAGVGADGAMLATLSADGAHLHVLTALGYDPKIVRAFSDMAMDTKVRRPRPCAPGGSSPGARRKNVTNTSLRSSACPAAPSRAQPSADRSG